MSMPNPKFTNGGKLLHLEALDGAPLTFTRIALGDGRLTNQSPAKLTALIHEVVTINITKSKRSSDYLIVGGLFNPATLSGEFWWRELGLYAIGASGIETLYCYANAFEEGEHIQPDAQVMERTLMVGTIVGDAQNVSAIIDTSLIFATQSDISDLQLQIEATETALHMLEEGKADLDLITGKVRGDQLPDMAYIPTAQKGAAGGVAELGPDGILKVDQRPPSLALGETSSTAYRGDRGKAAYDHVSDTIKHITSEERTAWNGKINNKDFLTAVEANDNKFTTSYSGFVGPDVAAAMGLPSKYYHIVGLHYTISGFGAQIAMSLSPHEGAVDMLIRNSNEATWGPWRKIAARELYTITLSATWTSASVGFTQTISVSGILATDTPVVGVVLTGTIATDQTLLENWALVSRIITSDNAITAFAYGDKPTVSLPLQLLVIR